VDTATSIKIVLLSMVAGGTNLTVSVTKVTNSYLTVPSSSFTIQTYYSDSSSLVDQLNSGLTVTATSVPLKSVIVTPTSLTVTAVTKYTFSVQSSYNIPSSSIIVLTFPTEVANGGYILNSFSVDGVAVSGCILSSISNSQISFSNLCIKSMVKNTSSISFSISNITNPSSFKPTSSFGVSVMNGIYQQ
jgi:hypothetical protein